MATGSDFLGSLLKGVASGARTFGTETMRRQSEQDAEKKAAQKQLEALRQQRLEVGILAQNDANWGVAADYMDEYIKQGGKAPVSPTTLKTLYEKVGPQEQAGADLLYNELMGTQGANWSPVAADAGVVPGMLGTPTGQAESASKMLDYGAFRDEQGELIAPFKRDADIGGMVEQRRAELARKQKREDIAEETRIREQTKDAVAAETDKAKGEGKSLSAKDQTLYDMYYGLYPKDEADALWRSHVENENTTDDARSMFKSMIGQEKGLGSMKADDFGRAARSSGYDPFNDATREDALREVARRLKTRQITKEEAADQIELVNIRFDNLDWYIEQEYDRPANQEQIKRAKEIGERLNAK